MSSEKPRPIAFFIPNLGGGGAQRVIINLVNGLVKTAKVPVHLIVGCRDYKMLDQIDPDVFVIRFHKKKVSHCVFALVRYLRFYQPVSICSSLSYANVICLIAWLISGKGARMVIRDDGVLPIVRGLSLSYRIRLQLMRVLYPLADHSISVSRGVQASLTSHNIIPGITSHIIYNPLQVSEKLGEDVDSSIGHQELPLKFICAVGRLTHVKGFDLLITAFSKLKDSSCGLVIVGDGPEMEYLKTLSFQLNVASRVRFCGWVSYPEFIMRRASLLVVPSRSEGFGNVVVEALQNNVSVVAFDCPGGVGEILANGVYGRLVPNGDVDALACTIEEMLQNPHEFDGVKVERGQDFSFEKILPKYLEVLI